MIKMVGFCTTVLESPGSFMLDDLGYFWQCKFSFALKQVHQPAVDSFHFKPNLWWIEVFL